MNPRRNSMKSGIRPATALLALLGWAGVSLAQHEGHSMGGAPTGEAACQAHAKEGIRIVENANRRLEEARQSNSPQQMRAAISELQAALAEVRTHLSLCGSPAPGGSGAPGMEGMDHSKMGTEKPPAPKAQKPAYGEMDHSKMEQEKPGAPKPEKPRSTGVDHSKMGQEKPAAPPAVQTQVTVDPVCGMEVSAQATEKATYQGKTYDFCSRADREKFLSDPAKYVNR